MPKVLRIINRFNLGGPTYNAAYLTKYLSTNYETLLIGGEKDKTEDSSQYILEKLGVNSLIIREMRRSINPFQDIIAFLKIRKIIKEFKPDIVHTHASKAGTLGRLAAKSAGVKIILHTFHGHVFHSYFGKFKTSIILNIERFLASLSTKIITISDKQKDELLNDYKICSDNKLVVIPLGFDLSRFTENMDIKRKEFRKKYQLDDDEIAIGIIGRLVPIKNHKLFIDSIKYISTKSSKRIRAFIIGGGELFDDLNLYCNSQNIDYTDFNLNPKKALITFTSWIKEIDNANAGLDIVCLTSFNEGTPVSLIEAQASNKPIISTKVGGIENIVIEGETALLSENDNLFEFKNNLLKIVQDSELRAKLGSNGWEHVYKNFHYTRLVKDVETLYNELI